MRNPFILAPLIPATRFEFLAGFVLWVAIAGAIGGIIGGVAVAYPDGVSLKTISFFKGLGVGVGFIGLASICARRLTDIGVPWWLVFILPSLRGVPLPLSVSICIFVIVMCLFLFYPSKRRKATQVSDAENETKKL